MGGSIQVEEAGFGNKTGLRIEYGGLEEVTKGSVVFRVSLDGETVDGELYISRGKSEGQPGIIARLEGLIELVDKSIKKGGIGSSRNEGVDNGEGDRKIVFNKDFEVDSEARVSIPQNRGGQVGPTNADKIAFRVGGRHVSEGVASPCSTGKRSRTLG